MRLQINLRHDFHIGTTDVKLESQKLINYWDYFHTYKLSGLFLQYFKDLYLAL